MSHVITYLNTRFPKAQRRAMIGLAVVALALVAIGVMLAEPMPERPLDGPYPTLTEAEVQWRQHCYDLYLDDSAYDLSGAPVLTDPAMWAACVEMQP